MVSKMFAAIGFFVSVKNIYKKLGSLSLSLSLLVFVCLFFFVCSPSPTTNITDCIGF